MNSGSDRESSPPGPVQGPQAKIPMAAKPSVYMQTIEALGPNFMDHAVGFPPIELPHEPQWYFFYGTLTKPDLLKRILDLNSEETPVLRPAKVTGYALTSWGQYPALIDGKQGQEVHGFAYQVQTIEQEYKLAQYETNAYELRGCIIEFTDGVEKDGVPEEVIGNTFGYAGDAQALQQERFDRVLWERQMGMRLPFKWRTR